MSKFLMYSVRDELTGKFMQPMFMEEEEHAEMIAKRHFATNVNNIQLWKDNPNDYALYLVGKFDDETGAEACMVEKIISGRSVLYGQREN